jgi:hypothetical protein
VSDESRDPFEPLSDPQMLLRNMVIKQTGRRAAFLFLRSVARNREKTRELLLEYDLVDQVAGRRRGGEATWRQLFEIAYGEPFDHVQTSARESA